MQFFLLKSFNNIKIKLLLLKLFKGSKVVTDKTVALVYHINIFCLSLKLTAKDFTRLKLNFKVIILSTKIKYFPKILTKLSVKLCSSMIL